MERPEHSLETAKGIWSYLHEELPHLLVLRSNKKMKAMSKVMSTLVGEITSRFGHESYVFHEPHGTAGSD